MATKTTGKVNEPSKATRADRPVSFNLEDFPMPVGREEDWRFTPMRRVKPLLEEQTEYLAPKVEVQGPEGVLVENVAMDDSRVGIVLAPGDRPAALAWNKTKEAVVITVPADIELTEPVMVHVTAPRAASAGHIVVRTERHAKATVVLIHDGPAILNQTVEVRADDGSTLNFVAVHNWDRDALHASAHRVSVGRDANLTHMIVTLGGDLVRVTIDSELKEQGGNLNLNGLYFVDPGQNLEHRVFIHHTAPNCYSRSAYKGALQGKDAHAVWIGDCLIGRDADNTDTYELNRNLILTEGAKADSVPNLEIENGEIEGAGHASATGRFDDDQLFYLMSRGVSAVDARRLVVRGFFAELVNQIGIADLQDSLMEEIDHRLREYNERLAEQVTAN